MIQGEQVTRLTRTGSGAKVPAQLSDVSNSAIRASLWNVHFECRRSFHKVEQALPNLSAVVGAVRQTIHRPCIYKPSKRQW